VTLLPTASLVDEALAFLRDRQLVVLTGAGLSTDSGIPDYRGPGSVPRSPMTYQQFVSGPEARQRYWARVHVGFGRFSTAAPNEGHRALARLDPTLLITQNVDGLHEAAGTRRLVALLGRISDVACLSCRGTSSRRSLERRLAGANPGWAEEHADLVLRPDGDVDLVRETRTFVVPDCEQCGGILKPDVVFFGELLPAAAIERATELARGARLLLVVGSALEVYPVAGLPSQTLQAGGKLAIVNRGPTPYDDEATVRVESSAGEVLPAVVSALA
jgi:NAD-dependent SIR2 family protein deacetylase